MRDDTFAGQVIRALARRTPAYGADTAAPDNSFGRSVLLALRRRTRAFVEQPPDDADAILDRLEADLASADATAGHARPERSGPGVLYQSERVTVTPRVLFVDGDRYAIAALRYLHSRTARRPPTPGVAAGTAAGWILLGAMIGLAAVLPVAMTASLALAGLIALTTAVVIRRRTPSHELWAQHHGAETLLFTTPDRREQQAVARAVLRAMRMIDDTSLV
ncbi:DUF6232 family protein [Virgisporangium aurantiacum]|uniref:Uncharacterized protein n=1 Tax=Virgisporangium aurantiacum TaxID=175570 RepID=A0A8J3ZNY6_9ACTN|nr:DUF6232 family protein [Virgisporangium aurantiacum]GIJ65016.1 hypothetical protein Vau01_125320 [Virgisporangium aurantiacum]